MKPNLTDTTSETSHVGKTVSRYFKHNGISHLEAAKRLGCTKQTVSNRMIDTTFKLKTTMRYVRAFGFNKDFLLTGKGELFSSEQNENFPKMGIQNSRDTEIETLLKIIRSQQETIQILTNRLTENK